MNYKLIQDRFEDHSVVDENGKIISQHIVFAGQGEVLIQQLNWGMIKPDDVMVNKPDIKRPKHYIIFGGNGFLGSAFVNRIKNIDEGCYVTSITRKEYEYGDRDNENNLVNLFNDFCKTCRQQELIPIVINCIGIADTRLCEVNPQLAMKINAEWPKILSKECDTRGIKLVHISTGCLYHGIQKYHKETDFLEAHCNYTVSKWVGEYYLHSNDLVLRPRLLFDWVDNKFNLLTKLPKFDSYLNEFNSITSLDTIIEATVALVKAKQSGIFNVCNSGAYTIENIANSIGLYGKRIQEKDLHESQKLFLVNNLMCTLKLQQFYTPRDILDEVRRCYKKNKNTQIYSIPILK